MSCGNLKRQTLFILAIILSTSPITRGALASDPKNAATKNAATQYVLENWTTENGLPQNSINDILQTRDGYLWLASHGGLVRFDGTRFVVFDRSVEGIRSQRIKALCEDSKGTLWAGTEEGMLIRYRNGEFTTYTPEDRLHGEEAFRIEEDYEGNLWITGRGVVIKFDGERFVNYRRDFGQGVSGYPDAGRVSWSQDSGGLHCFVKGRVERYSLPIRLRTARIIGVSIDRYGNLWAQTGGSGVVKLTNGESKLYTVREGLPSNDVEGIFFEDRKGNLWFADYKSSLYRIRDGKYELTRIFRTNSLSTLYEDREGSIWIGTLEGLHRIRESAITLYTEREGLSWNWAYSILQDRASAIWIGTWGRGGVNKYENGRFTRYGAAEGLPSDQITCIYEDNSGRLWVGAFGGIGYFSNGRFERYKDKYGCLKHDVWAMLQDRVGNLWFGTDAGLVKLKDGGFTVYGTKDGLSYDAIRSLFEDRDNTLWIGTDQGLTRLKDGVFTAYTERDGFIGNQVRAIYEDSDGVLWIGTYDGGLYRFKDERLTRYTTKEGLHDNGVFQILEDDVGNLWMGCNRGIYRVSRRELNDFAEGSARSITSVVYGTKDGLATLECNGGRQPSGLKTKDGKLWFPTMGGVAVIDPKTMQISPAPSVIIEEFRIGNEAIDFLGGVRIGPDKETFEIRYTAPSFIKPDHVRFRYKLIGLDKDWIDAGNRRTANYYRIPSGRYEFVLIAANSDGVWNTQGESIEIVIVPPFWRTRWFQVLGLLLLGCILFLAHRRRVHHLRRKHEEQKAFSQKLIESQESERKRIASELHDGLGHDLLLVKNSALLGLTMVEDGSPQKDQFDEISEQTSKALAGIREIAQNLRPYHLDRLGLRDALEFMLEEAGRSSDIRFSTEIDPIEGLFWKEAELSMYRIVEESINNIIKHSGATEAKVVLRHEGRRVQLTIEDNGKGFSPNSSSPSGKHARGFGLTGISERARMLGAKEVIDSIPGQGTSITVMVMIQDK